MKWCYTSTNGVTGPAKVQQLTMNSLESVGGGPGSFGGGRKVKNGFAVLRLNRYYYHASTTFSVSWANCNRPDDRVPRRRRELEPGPSFGHEQADSLVPNCPIVSHRTMAMQ
jgi:hypothetical protein